MKAQICQSCGLSFTLEDRGSNRDGSENNDYCASCLQHGKFTDNSLTLHELEVKLLEMAEVHNEITLEEAESIIKILPDLKRWRMSNL